MTFDPEHALKLCDEADAVTEGVTEGPWNASPYWFYGEDGEPGYWHIAFSDGKPREMFDKAPAHFIAASRNLVPALSSALREAVEENEQLRELASSSTGMDVVGPMKRRLDAMAAAVNAADAPEAYRNLIGALTHTLVIAVANGKWAALEHLRVEELEKELGGQVRSRAVLRTPDEWCEEFHIIVLDPDGWREDGTAWGYPLTRGEFMKRQSRSTCGPADGYTWDDARAAMKEGRE